MELIKNDLVKASGAMFNEAGINTLTIDKLALKMGINPTELLVMMLLCLDNEMQQLIFNVVTKPQLPKEELNSQ